MNMNEGQPISRREALKRGGKIVAPFLVPGVLNLIAAACAPRSTQVPAQAAELSSPTAVPTEAKPTAAPTEPPKPTAGPKIEQLSRQEALNQVRGLVGKVQNPNRELIAQYGITQDQLKSNEDYILQGAPDRLIPGLIDVRVSIEQGDLALAHKQLVDVFTTWLLARGIVRDDSIILSEEEKVKADPENQYFGRRAPMFSAVRKEMALDTLKVLYGLQSYAQK